MKRTGSSRRLGCLMATVLIPRSEPIRRGPSRPRTAESGDGAVGRIEKPRIVPHGRNSHDGNSADVK
jgi:hypothetical protein